MGTISGSGVANVVTVGQFTIPLMKRSGYKASFAGGVEATASMGGQIMPPVMGAVAFIMAENIGVPYARSSRPRSSRRCSTSLRLSGWCIWKRARTGLLGLAPKDLPNAGRAEAAVVPGAAAGGPGLAAVQRFTPLFAGSVGLALTVIMILGGSVALGHRPLGLRMRSGSRSGWSSCRCSNPARRPAERLAVLVARQFLCARGRRTLGHVPGCAGRRGAAGAPVGLACAIVGTVIGAMTLTGAATTFGGYIVSFGEKSLIFVCLLLVMVTSIILGTGTADHPDLHHHGIARRAGLAQTRRAADRQPHVRVLLRHHRRPDATGGAGRTRCRPDRQSFAGCIGWQATRIALAGFLIPFMSVFEPALMLQQGGGIGLQPGYWIEVAWVLFKAFVVIGMTGVAAIGFLFMRTSIAGRVLAGVAAGLLISPLPWTDQGGLLLASVIVIVNWSRARNAPERA